MAKEKRTDTVRHARGEVIKAARETVKQFAAYDADEVTLTDLRTAVEGMQEALSTLDDRLAAAAQVRESEKELQDA